MAKKTGGNPVGCPKVQMFKLGDIHPAEYNPRIISDENITGLRNSIAEFGCVELIIVNVRDGKNTIVGGHQRYKVLQATGVEECVCVTVDFDQAKEKLLNLNLNNPQIQGEFIAEIDAYIQKLQDEVGDDLIIKLRINQMRDELGFEEKTGKILDDEIPAPPKETITKTGDLWKLGQHRLLCGDSTKPEDVARLMDGNKANLFATDPPYCVNYTGADRSNGGKDWSDVYHEEQIPDSSKFMTAYLKLGLEYIKPKTAIYIWHASSKLPEIRGVCDKMGILIHQQIIWVKPCAVFSFSFYAWQHEPCLLMWKRGGQPAFNPKNKKLGTVWPVSLIKTGDPSTPEYYTDVWELDWNGKKRQPGEVEHPTVKPVEVFAIPMRVHTSPGDICYEPFSGGGTQIIAAEKLSRRCFAMELEPFFVDVAVKRWEEWTGQKAERIK